MFTPAGVLDESATVLGLRTLALTEPAGFDAVVPMRSLLQRLERAQADGTTQIGLPMEVNTATWAAISPPRGGWSQQPGIDSALLESTAHAGIAEVAAAVPTGTGEQIVHRVRSEVWGRAIAGYDNIPGGAGFAALGLGFLPPSGAAAATGSGNDGESEQVRVYETGPWTRLTTRRGHVLVKRRAWSIAH